jgi:hypothetical protein
MLHHQERIIRQPHNSSDVSRRHLERFRAQNQRPFPKLFKADAIMQTARRARASIAGPSNQEIDFRGGLGENARWRGSAGVRLRVNRSARRLAVIASTFRLVAQLNAEITVESKLQGCLALWH